MMDVHISRLQLVEVAAMFLICKIEEVIIWSSLMEREHLLNVIAVEKEDY